MCCGFARGGGAAPKRGAAGLHTIGCGSEARWHSPCDGQVEPEGPKLAELAEGAAAEWLGVPGSWRRFWAHSGSRRGSWGVRRLAAGLL